MRRLALILIFALLPLAAATPRPAPVARAAQRCPAVSVSCLDTAGPGEEPTFMASVDAAASDVKYAYRWDVSAGAIAAGQGTPSLKVDMTGVGSDVVTATVDVTGLAAACARSASCTTAVIQPIRCHRPLDEYGDISFEDEQARLDNFAIEVQNDPTATAYVVCYGGRVGYEGAARRRCERAKDYISNVRGIDADRILTEDGGFKEDLTVTLWLLPSGATRPQPNPTVDPSGVKIIKPRPTAKPRGR